MTHREFCYWLDGFLSLEKKPQLTLKQLIILESHLNLVAMVDGQPRGFVAWLKNEIIALKATNDYSNPRMSSFTLLVQKELSKVDIAKLPKQPYSPLR